MAQRAALVRASPHQIPRCLGGEQLLEHDFESWVTRLGNRSAPALIANAARRRALQFLLELARPTLNGLTSQTRHTSHELDATMTVALSFECTLPATLLFVETRDEHVGLAMQSGRRLIGS
jgi:hypothetical protein